MGHPQPHTLIHCNNVTAVGIANETVKKHQSRPMEMRYFYSCNQVKRRLFAVHYHPGLECLGDYPSKHHITSHHINVRPIYLHTQNSPMLLPRAPKPSDLRGCVGKTVGGYKRGRPLPVLPRTGRGRPRLYPTTVFPTHPLRSLGFGALGSNMGKFCVCRYIGLTLMWWDVMWCFDG